VLIFSVYSGSRQVRAEAEYLAPDFKLQDIKGNSVSLSSYLGKEAVILLFWTTWCPYCRKELKNLNGIYQELKKEGFEVLAVNVGEALYKVDNFTRDYQLNYKVLLDKDISVAYSYGLVGVPFYLIIDKQGKVRFADSYFPHNEYKKLAAL
jgi:peroxiredoxin